MIETSYFGVTIADLSTILVLTTMRMPPFLFLPLSPLVHESRRNSICSNWFPTYPRCQFSIVFIPDHISSSNSIPFHSSPPFLLPPPSLRPKQSMGYRVWLPTRKKQILCLSTLLRQLPVSLCHTCQPRISSYEYWIRFQSRTDQ